MSTAAKTLGEKRTKNNKIVWKPIIYIVLRELGVQLGMNKSLLSSVFVDNQARTNKTGTSKVGAISKAQKSAKFSNL